MDALGMPIDGALTTAEYWEYDSRLGRRWNTDPVVKPWESPYACFSNNPIYFVDPLGLSSSTVTPKGNTQNTSGTWETHNSDDTYTCKTADPMKLDEVVITPQDNTAVNKPNIIKIGDKNQQSNEPPLPSWADKMIRNLRRLDNFVEHCHDESSKNPLSTNFRGIQQTGGGGNKNVYFYGYPYFNDYSYTPGSNLQIDANPICWTQCDIYERADALYKAFYVYRKSVGNFGETSKKIVDDVFGMNRNTSSSDKPKLRVIHDSELFWHVEHSANGAHKYYVETWQAKGDSGKAENDRKQYRSVHKKIEID